MPKDLKWDTCVTGLLIIQSVWLSTETCLFVMVLYMLRDNLLALNHEFNEVCSELMLSFRSSFA